MKVQPNNIILLLMCLLFALLTACGNSQKESTQSGEGDNFDQSHPMESEGTNEPVTDTTAPVPTSTDPAAN